MTQKDQGGANNFLLLWFLDLVQEFDCMLCALKDPDVFRETHSNQLLLECFALEWVLFDDYD